MCPTIRSTSLSLAIIHDHPRIRTRVNAIERYSSFSERIKYAIVADGGWRATVLVCAIRSDIRYERDPVPPRAVARIPAHAENNVRSPRFLLRRPRRRLQGDQGPSTYSVFFRRSTVVVVPRETRREGRRERASAREGDTIGARGGRAMDDAGRCDRRARAVTTNEKALGISYPPIVSSVASSRATTDARARARATERSRWIAIDRGSIDSGGGIGYFV